MSKALKKTTSVLLMAVVSALYAAGCSADEDIQQPEPDISDTASVTAAEEARDTDTEETAATTNSADETTTTVATTSAAATVTTASVITTATTTSETKTTTVTTTAKTTTAPTPVATTTTEPHSTTTTKPHATTTTTNPPATTAAPSASSSEDFTEEVFRLVNRIRAEYGLPAYKRLDALTDAAQRRAVEISGYYSHTRPSGQQSYSVMKEYGLNYSFTGENIAAGQSTPQAVVNDWMSSTMGHREAILSSQYQYMGVGCVCLTSGDRQGYKYYWTQEFYTPLR